MSDKNILELERDNAINKSKIESLQRTDGIINEQLKILTKNVLHVSDRCADIQEDPVSNSILPLDIGTKPETTIHEHRYFGVAPTSYETVAPHSSGNKEIRFEGFHILVDANFSTQVLDGGGSGFNPRFNMARVNLNLESSSQTYNSAGELNLSSIFWSDDSGWGDHWNNTKTPIVYTRAYTKISPVQVPQTPPPGRLPGTLESRVVWKQNTNAPSSGHIVSAAAPSGPWVIRSSWDYRSNPHSASGSIYREIGALSTNYDHKIFNTDDTIWSVLESLARLI